MLMDAPSVLRAAHKLLMYCLKVHVFVYTSAKIIQFNEYGCRDAPCEKSWKQGIPLALLSRILAQSCVTFCLNYVGRVTHDCGSLLDSISKGIPCFHDFSHGAALHPYSFN